MKWMAAAAMVSALMAGCGSEVRGEVFDQEAGCFRPAEVLGGADVGSVLEEQTAFARDPETGRVAFFESRTFPEALGWRLCISLADCPEIEAGITSEGDRRRCVQ
jgi:hypothetical protein